MYPLMRGAPVVLPLSAISLVRVESVPVQVEQGEFEMATATQNQNVITTNEFHVSKEFLALTEKQRIWIDSFIESQDAELATRTAYKSGSDVYMKLFTYRIEANPRIVAALNLFYGRSPREAFLQELQQDIRRSPKGSIARIQAQNLYARMAFGSDSENPTVPSTETETSMQQFPIGAVIVQDDKKISR
jgi:hypothetical protein